MNVSSGFKGENKMKYNIGDKVKIRENLIDNEEYGGCYINDKMIEYSGKTVTIAQVREYHYYDDGVAYHIIEDGGRWVWGSDIFESRDAWSDKSGYVAKHKLRRRYKHDRRKYSHGVEFMG